MAGADALCEILDIPAGMEDGKGTIAIHVF
jgi:hypothetical protein